ncbi:MAG: DUF86 domain-containing protein [Chitinispirillaceae bacterium]|nr:DUF86 domain-containing protein [Chitinispirillaceae bacterium]
MKREHALFVSDILECMDDAMTYVAGMTYDEFVKDSRTRRAVVQCIENIGEAAKNTPDDIRELKPRLPWRDMARMRDKCIHTYFGINYEIVWSTVKNNIPAARSMIAELLEEVRGLERRK